MRVLMQAADAANSAAGADPPWVAITLAAIAVVGTLGTAYVPVLQERARARSAARADAAAEQPAVAEPPPPASPPPPPPQDSFDLVEQAVFDAFKQRDAALARADRLQQQLDDLRTALAQADARIAALQARERRY